MNHIHYIYLFITIFLTGFITVFHYEFSDDHIKQHIFETTCFQLQEYSNVNSPDERNR
jgi:hypothetical protein